MQNKHEQSHHHGEIVHGHSRLVWLIDEVDAHVRGLAEAGGEELGPIEEELARYWREFRAELAEHLHTEETQMFVAIVAGAPEMEADITMLRSQHRDLEEGVGALEETLARFSGAGADAPSLADVRREVSSLREQFAAHSRAERVVLGRAEELGIEVEH